MMTNAAQASAILALVMGVALSPVAAKDGHGLNLDKPGLIDAVATILFPYQSQEGFTRVDDDTVLVELTSGFILQLQKLPSRECGFQTRRLNDSNSAISQYNFAQLSGDYRTAANGYSASTNIIFDGEAAWCEKDKAGLRCFNSIHTAVYGLNDSRKVMRAMAFIQQNFCPPAKPKRPF